MAVLNMHVPTSLGSARGRVLVVDDADDLRHLVATVLRTSGFDVVEAATAGEALAALEARHIDTLFVDIELGSSNGLDLVAAVRDSPLGTGVRVALMSASPRVAPERLEALGVTVVLAKPVSFDDIVGAARGDDDATGTSPAG